MPMAVKQNRERRRW